MKIHGLNKTTLLDFPEHLACTVFTGNCNFRCPFCHNGELVLCPETEPEISEEDFFNFLDKRGKRIEGVAITGGEPTLQSDLKTFIEQIKNRGLLVKLDTNGYNPEILKDLIDSSLLDYVAMDIKSSKEGYAAASGLSNIDISRIETSVDLLRNGTTPYEFRTTVCRELHGEKEFREIAEWIKGCKDYYLQDYRPGGTILAEMKEDLRVLYANGFSCYKPEELKAYEKLLVSLGVNAHLRGIA